MSARNRAMGHLPTHQGSYAKRRVRAISPWPTHNIGVEQPAAGGLMRSAVLLFHGFLLGVAIACSSPQPPAASAAAAAVPPAPAPTPTAAPPPAPAPPPKPAALATAEGPFSGVRA